MLRGVLRYPLSVFEAYKMQRFNNAYYCNLYMLYASMVGIMIVGKGAEKMVCKHPASNAVENYRKLSRYYLPYSLVSYKHMYPKKL